MASSLGDGLAKDLIIILGLIIVQFSLGSYIVIMNQFLSQGLNSLFIVIFINLIISVVVLPIALILERKIRTCKLTPALMAQFVFIALGQVTVNQALTFYGVKRTSAAIAAAMPNLAPGLVFIIAVCFKLERFEVRNKWSLAKAMGTVVCFSGAMAMTFLKTSQAVANAATVSEEEWILGCFSILAAVVIQSCCMVLQGAIMVTFPAPFTLCFVMSSLGSAFTPLLQIAMEGKLEIGSLAVNPTRIIASMTGLGVVVSLACSFQAWCVQQKGAFLVSIFNPIQAVCSALLSALVFGKLISFGSIAGMLLMFAGLYFVLWAKKKEGDNMHHADDDNHMLSANVSEKPLLS